VIFSLFKYYFIKIL